MADIITTAGRYVDELLVMDEAETEVLAYMTFPPAHRTKLHSTNPIERFNGEINRRTEVVDIFSSEDSITRLIGAILSSSRTMTRSAAQQMGRPACPLHDPGIRRNDG